MESGKVSLNDLNVKSPNLSKKKIEFTAAVDTTQKEDTVEINGEVKTAEKKKKKLSTDKKVLIGLGGFTALAGVFTAAMSLKHGKFKGSRLFPRKPVPFSHEPILKKIPTEQEIDAGILERIKDVKLDYGFDDSVKTEDAIKTFLKNNYPNAYWADNVAKKAAQNDDARHVLRVMTGKNFEEYFTKEKKPVGWYEISSVIDSIKGPVDKNDFETTIKLFIKDEKRFGFNLKNIITNNISNLKDIKRIYQLGNVINEDKNFREHVVNITDLAEKKNVKFKDIAELLSTLKKGTITDTYGRMSFCDLTSLIKDENTNIKSLIKFLKSLKNDTSEHVKLASIKEIYSTKELTPKQASEKLNKIPEKILKKMTGEYDAANYLRFEDFIDKKNINELTLAEKKKLMDNLIKNNSRSFNTYGNLDSSQLFPLLPNNQKKYCELLQKLAKSIGINTKPLTPAEIKAFNQGLEELGSEIKHIDIDNIHLKMKMSRKDFTDKATDLMSSLEEGEQRKVMDYFGFEINDNKLKGYPINLNNGEKLNDITQNKTKAVIEKLRPVVVEFSEQNPVTVVNGSKAFEKALNDVLAGLPELRPMIGKAQHGTHDYGLDIHTLKVLQGVTSHPKYASLSKEDQKLLSVSSLLHDITKTEGLRDPLHPIESSFDAYYIIQKMNLPEEKQLKVYELIKSHNWLDRLNNPKNTPEMIESIAQDIAFDARHTNTFELAKILCEADMKAVKKDTSFFDKHRRTLQTMSDKVDGYIRRIHETQIVLPQTKIPNASKLTGATEKSANGIKNKVIYMDKADNDLSKLGFESGTTKENWRGLIHALDREDQMQNFNTFSVIDTEALLSTSYIDTKGYRVFRKQGLVLDVNSNDIHAGYFRDFGSGYSKDIELLKADYLFNGKRNSDIADRWRGDRSEYRNYISEVIKKEMGITNEQYIKLMEKIQSCKSITDIKKVDENFADKLQKIFSEMDAGKRRGGRQYNEMLVTRPKIQAVFAYDEPYEKIPEFLRKYAADNDLPIIIFGNK